MNETSSIRIVVADTEPVFRYGVRRLVESTRHIRVVAEAGDMLEAIAAVRDCRPDLLMLTFDIDGGGLDGLAALSALDLPVRCIVLTGTQERQQASETPGVHGVLPKHAPGATYIKCIQAVKQNRRWTGHDAPDDPVTVAETAAAAGAYRLTRREAQIVTAVVNGSANKDIAADLSISLDTVKHHLANVFDKTGVSSRLELAVFALYHGLASID
jgi:two-component system, NarL family, nitrate/nitrite response regulator NarL